MQSSKRTKQKRDDRQLLILAKLGFSSGVIAQQLGIHPTTVKNRLAKYQLTAVDSRHNFVQQFIGVLPEEVLVWLSEKITPSNPLPEYLYGLIIENYNRHKAQANVKPEPRTNASS